MLCRQKMSFTKLPIPRNGLNWWALRVPSWSSSLCTVSCSHATSVTGLDKRVMIFTPANPPLPHLAGCIFHCLPSSFLFLSFFLSITQASQSNSIISSTLLQLSLNLLTLPHSSPTQSNHVIYSKQSYHQLKVTMSSPRIISLLFIIINMCKATYYKSGGCHTRVAASLQLTYLNGNLKASRT